MSRKAVAGRVAAVAALSCFVVPLVAWSLSCAADTARARDKDGGNKAEAVSLEIVKAVTESTQDRNQSWNGESELQKQTWE